MTQTSNAINWPWVLRSRADAAYLGDTEGTVKLLQQAADYIEAALSTPPQAVAEVSEGKGARLTLIEVEKLFPEWKSYRDLIDCIECTLHELRKS